LRHEIEAARTLLAAPALTPAAIHDARKHFKRIRALLDLMRATDGKGPIQELRRTVAEAGRALAPMRDARVATLAAKTMQNECTSPKQALAFADLVSWLQARSDRLEESVSAFSSGAALSYLDKARRQLAGIPFDSAGRRALIEAAAKTYKRGRRAMRTALGSGEDVALHEWRKQVQRHWRQMDLLRQALSKRDRKKRIALAKRLSDLLGEHHDLSVLKGMIVANGSVFEQPGEFKALCDAIDKRKRMLAVEAERLGCKLYARRAVGSVAKMRRRCRRRDKRLPKAQALSAKLDGNTAGGDDA
jgi:hypothetical protein